MDRATFRRTLVDEFEREGRKHREESDRLMEGTTENGTPSFTIDSSTAPRPVKSLKTASTHAKTVCTELLGALLSGIRRTRKRSTVGARRGSWSNGNGDLAISRNKDDRSRLTISIIIVGIKKAANTYSWGTHRPWAARGTGARTIPGDIRRRCAGAWARTDIRLERT